MSDPENKRPVEDEAEVKSELFSHPLALPAIAVTLGFGAASQIFGFWMGAMSGAMQVSRRIADANAPLGGTAADEASLLKSPKPTIVKTRPAVGQIIADASTAVEAAKSVASETTAKVIELRPAKTEPAKAGPVKADPAKVKPAGAPVEASADDLKVISGIGPKLEQVLNKMGVSTYAQISSWTDADVSRIEEHFGFPGRVLRDGWIDQASKLIAGKKSG
jgi:NADH-quinone oxidoreductase subunit E